MIFYLWLVHVHFPSATSLQSLCHESSAFTPYTSYFVRLSPLGTYISKASLMIEKIKHKKPNMIFPPNSHFKNFLYCHYVPLYFFRKSTTECFRRSTIYLLCIAFLFRLTFLCKLTMIFSSYYSISLLFLQAYSVCLLILFSCFLGFSSQ